MNKRIFVTPAIVLLVLVLLTGCGGPVVQPFALGQAPWSNGEISTYDVVNNGQNIGVATWTWQQSAGEWTQSYQLSLSGRLDQGGVILSSDLAPISSWHELSGQRFETSYAVSSISVKSIASDGTESVKQIDRPNDAIDNDVSLQVQRALPFADSFATQYNDVIPTSAQSVAVKVVVDGKVSITVPAGTFETWHVVMSFGGSSAHDGWYAVDAPHALVQYRNRSSGSEFRLSSLVAGNGGTPAVTASPAAPTMPSSASAQDSQSPSLNVPFTVAALAVQFPLMVLFPLALGWWLHKRFGLSWGIFGAGMLTFIASQVVHLPLNYALGLIGSPRAVGIWPIVPLAIVAGLSAGVCEEMARYVVLRFFLKKTRGWRPALQFGAGHGAVEAIILGIIVLLTFISMMVLRSADLATWGLTGATADQTRAAVAAYWSNAWYLPILGGLERVMALSIHVAMAVLVMRALTRNQIGYLFAAILGHALVDFVAVWAGTLVSSIALEGILAVLGAIALFITLRLRETPVEEPASEPSGGPDAASLGRHALSSDELARRVDRSKYE